MSSLKRLITEARRCERCFGNEDIYVPLPDPKNSDGKARAVFVNERPGRIGTGASGYVSFDNDDPSANFFKECFESTGLERRDVFITNACLCHPNFPGYTDTKPKVREIRNCHYWLEQQLAIAQPELIVTVGAVALQSVLRFFDKWSTYKAAPFLSLVGNPIHLSDPIILPLAHTSRLGRANRNAELQRQDWKQIRPLLKGERNAT